MITLLAVLSVVLISLFLLFTCVNESFEDTPDSINQLYYQLKNPFYQAPMFVYAFFTLPPLLDSLAGNDFQFLGFLWEISMLVFIIFPKYRGGDKTVNLIATTLSLILMFLILIAVCPWLLLIWIAWPVYIITMMKKIYKQYEPKKRFMLIKPLFIAQVITIIITSILIFL